MSPKQYLMCIKTNTRTRTTYIQEVNSRNLIILVFAICSTPITLVVLAKCRLYYEKQEQSYVFVCSFDIGQIFLLYFSYFVLGLYTSMKWQTGIYLVMAGLCFLKTTKIFLENLPDHIYCVW